jgi:hypothetical protein
VLRTRTYREKAALDARKAERLADRAKVEAVLHPPADQAPAVEVTPPRLPPAVPPVTVTTERAPAEPIRKRGEVLSPTLLRWVRAQPCEFPQTDEHPMRPGHPGGDPHHEPTTGSNGVQQDPLVVACCRRAHDLCDAANGWSKEQREAAAHRTWVRFWRMADPETKAAALREMLACVEDL